MFARTLFDFESHRHLNPSLISLLAEEVVCGNYNCRHVVACPVGRQGHNESDGRANIRSMNLF